MQTPISVAWAKKLARSLKTSLQPQAVYLGYNTCLEIVAAQHGYDSYNALVALNPQEDPAAEPKPASLADFDDLDLTEELRQRGWLFAARTTIDAIHERFPDLDRAFIAEQAPRIEDAAGTSSIPGIFREIEAQVLEDAAEDAKTPGSDVYDPNLQNVGQLAARELRRLVTQIATSLWNLPHTPEIAELRLHPHDPEGSRMMVEPLAEDGSPVVVAPASFEIWARQNAGTLSALDRQLRSLNFPESDDRLPSISMPGPLDPLVFPKGLPALGTADPAVQETDIYYLHAAQIDKNAMRRAVVRLRRLRPELFADDSA